MGFEYKIVAKLSDAQTEEIQRELSSHHMFESRYEFNEKEFWEFRHKDNKGKMSNLSIVFEMDGIYVCQHGHSYLWTDIENLKKCLEAENVSYTVIDYQI